VCISKLCHKYLDDIALHSICRHGNQIHRGDSRSICLFSHFGENFRNEKSLGFFLFSFVCTLAHSLKDWLFNHANLP